MSRRNANIEKHENARETMDLNAWMIQWQIAELVMNSMQIFFCGRFWNASLLVLFIGFSIQNWCVMENHSTIIKTANYIQISEKMPLSLS